MSQNQQITMQAHHKRAHSTNVQSIYRKMEAHNKIALDTDVQSIHMKKLNKLQKYIHFQPTKLN